MHRRWFLITAALILAACRSVPETASPTSILTSTPDSLAGLPSCEFRTPQPDQSVLPPFTPEYPCQLERSSNSVDFCVVHASDTLSYPCSQHESVSETQIGDGDQTVLIQRDYRLSEGCWTASTMETRSLKVCDTTTGVSTTLIDRVVPIDPVASPDGEWWFIAAFIDSGLEMHLYIIRPDGSDLTQLDTQPLPQAYIYGATDLHWSEDGEWIEVTLWDGRDTEEGWHPYRIRTDGSGEFIVLE